MPRMPQRLRARLTYANVMATIAVFMGLGGGAYAAATIGSSDIEKSAVLSRHIANGQVRGPDVASGAVATGKIANVAVTTGKMASGAVTAAKLGDGAVVAAKLADGAVATDKLAGGAVTGPKLAPGAVGSDNVADGTLVADDLAPDEVYLSAVVRANGTLVRGRGAGAANRINEGSYSVDFGRNVTQCAFLAGVSLPDGYVSLSHEVPTVLKAGASNSVTGRVLVTASGQSSTGSVVARDSDFHLLVLC